MKVYFRLRYITTCYHRYILYIIIILRRKVSHEIFSYELCLVIITNDCMQMFVANKQCALALTILTFYKRT